MPTNEAITLIEAVLELIRLKPSKPGLKAYLDFCDFTCIEAWKENTVESIRGGAMTSEDLLLELAEIVSAADSEH